MQLLYGGSAISAISATFPPLIRHARQKRPFMLQLRCLLKVRIVKRRALWPRSASLHCGG